MFDRGLHLILLLEPALWRRSCCCRRTWLRLGTALEDILNFTAKAPLTDAGFGERALRARLAQLLAGADPVLERFADRAVVIEVRSSRLPDGGLVMTLTDTTASVAAAEALARANEELERRVRSEPRNSRH